MNLFMKTLFVVFVPQIEGENIMLRKPSKQSSKYSSSTSYQSTNGNDGFDSTRSLTRNLQSSYWQGDLVDAYRNLDITVTQYWNAYIYNAYIGVSNLDVDDPESDVIKCGQWRNGDQTLSKTFICNVKHPVQFVKIWREDAQYLGFAEISIENKTQRACKYTPMTSEKLSKPITSLTVAKVTECGTICYKTQPCNAFSFRKGGELNCLLGTLGNLESDTEWVTYEVTNCFLPTTCNGTGQV